MWKVYRPALLRYAGAVPIVALFVALRGLMDPFVGEQSPYVFLLPGIVLSAWLGGIGPGFFATLLSALAADWFFIEPIWSVLEYDKGLPEIVRIHIYIADGLIISWLVGQLHSSVQKSRRNEAELAQADKRKDDFLAVLGHELRNPLAPLSNGIELLKRRDADPETVRQTVEMMDRQVRLMTHLVDDLLDVARIRRGKVVLQKEVLALSEIVSAAVELCRPMIEARRHRLSFELPDVPVWVDADAIRLTQVLTNLLSNAAKYTPEGGEIRLSVRSTATNVSISVRDNGIGIAADRLPRVFELFQQADDSPAHTQTGLGLGLAVVRSLVQAHGGTITAHSGGPGRGSEFTVRLPVAAAASEERPSDQVRECDAGERSLRILLVDDRLDAARSLAQLLEFDGHQTRVVGDGPSALDEAGEWCPDVVLLDIGLPGIDGYEVARRLRARDAAYKPLLVATTGHGRPDDVRRARDAGFDHHLLKPVRLDELQRLLERPRTPSAAAR